MTAKSNPAQINIITVVDVIGALSDGRLDDNLYMMDNSILNSIGQGTDSLTTICHAGQDIQWVVHALDLQTPVSIKSITFIGVSGNIETGYEAEATETDSSRPDLNTWIGAVPYNLESGLSYRYKFEFQMGEGKDSIMFVDTPSLKLA